MKQQRGVNVRRWKGKGRRQQKGENTRSWRLGIVVVNMIGARAQRPGDRKHGNGAPRRECHRAEARAILSVHKSSVLYSRVWRDWKTLMDTTHSVACQQCQHADESCCPCCSDKGVMACECCSQCKMCCSHIGGVMANMPTTDIAAWTAAVCDGAEVVADALNCQAQMFGALLDHQTQSTDALLSEVCGMRAAIDRLSASGASSSQVAASTMDTDEDEDEDDKGEDMDRAVESDGVESGDDEDGKRVDIALAGTGADLGESTEEEEAEADEGEEEAEGSGPVRVAEAEMFMPPTSSGCIRMPRPTTHSWKGKEVEKMCWE